MELSDCYHFNGHVIITMINRRGENNTYRQFAFRNQGLMSTLMMIINFVMEFDD